MWRSEWELSKDSKLKKKLLIYNAEDCAALERVTNAVTKFCQRQVDAAKPADSNIVHADLLAREYTYYFGKFDSSIPEFNYINRAAYWDYQRDKVYVKSSQRVRRASRKIVKSYAKTLSVNTVIKCPPPISCPRCKSMKISKHGKMSKIVHDLKFNRTGIKRWIVKYLFDRYFCCQCGSTFISREKPWPRYKFGAELMSYIVYQIIDLQIPQMTVARSLKQIFDLDIPDMAVNRQKSVASDLYKNGYNHLLTRIVNGKLLHADETKISVEGKNAYVWVFTNLEEVVYLYTETREGDFLQELLREFKGVLVSDFYAAYDSINCPQQKCLIHLMRDLNNDLFKHPFNEELKELMREFAMLLKPMIETVDRFGLKAHFLRKHKVFVERFYRRLSEHNYKSEIAVHYTKRFEKNRDKLFTFLDYDGVPWNNNNAEHAIKTLARLRDLLGGSSTDKGIREYLVLLSIRETCKYKGVSFLDFLRSGKKDIDDFLGRQPECQKGSLPVSRRQTELTQAMVLE